MNVFALYAPGLMSKRDLSIDGGLKRRLLHLRILCGTKAEPVIGADALGRVEKALGVKLGDPLLAVLAAGGSLLQELEVRLDMLPTHTGYAHEAGLDAALLGIGRTANNEVMIGATPDGLKIHRLRLETEEVEVLETSKWLETLIAQQQLRLRDAKDKARARVVKAVTDEALDEFRPRIEEEQHERVQHGKFGQGVVLRELGGGKVEVRFGDQVKTLMRSFLQPVD